MKCCFLFNQIMPRLVISCSRLGKLQRKQQHTVISKALYYSHVSSPSTTSICRITMDIPTTMRSLVAPRQGGPEVYEVRKLPVPSITLPTHVLLKMHAAAANTGELQAVAGKMKLFHTPK